MIKLKEFPIYDESFLRQKSEPVENEMEALYIEAKLYELFPKTGAHAVAAPQIGMLKRAFLVKLPSNGEMLYVVNPEILSAEEPFMFRGEGCLSFPKKHKDTQRFKSLKVKFQYLDKRNETEDTIDVKLEERIAILSDVEAVIFQHEIDHLNGVLFKDHAQDHTIVSTAPKIGRNEPCHCGSGKKFKKCHGG